MGVRSDGSLEEPEADHDRDKGGNLDFLMTENN